jgi:acyl-CoA synthetase (AMP-forming)/AMP-acid ligase II
MTGALATLLQESYSGGGRLTSLPTGKEINYDAVNASAEALAFSLQNSGLMPNEPVHVSIANRSEDLSAMLGVWLAGGVVVPVHAFAASRTIQGMQTATGARFIVDRESIIQVATSPPVPRELHAEAALIIFTSGTTGKPKGVVITHSAFSGKLEVLRNLLKIRSEDVVLLPLHLTFIFGIWAAFLTIISKGNLILVRKFDNDVVTKALADSATVLVAVPSLLRTIFTQSLPQARHLRMILTGGGIICPRAKQTGFCRLAERNNHRPVWFDGDWLL